MAVEENKDHRKIPFDTHYKHHMWTEGQIESQEKRRERLTKLGYDIVKSLVIMAITAGIALMVLGRNSQIQQIVDDKINSHVTKNVEGK